jgi:FkbM family methyltransferase
MKLWLAGDMDQGEIQVDVCVHTCDHRRRSHLLLKLRPLWLREIVSTHFVLRRVIDKRLFEHVHLEFAPTVCLQLKPTDREHKRMTVQGFTELAVSRRIARLAKQGGLLVDVGANYGYYTCIWAAANASNRVIAFEPSPRNLGPLRRNISRNALGSQVDVRINAVGISSGQGHFWLGPEEETGWGGLLTTDKYDSVAVDVVSLDHGLSSVLEPINVLKVDTEGADTWVLSGARTLLANHQVTHVFFEDNPERRNALGISRVEAHQMLKCCGYKIEALGEGQYYAHVP